MPTAGTRTKSIFLPLAHMVHAIKAFLEISQLIAFAGKTNTLGETQANN